MPATRKREFLQLAHKFDEQRHHVCGWYVSEKLDGIRAWWDGGVTRGFWASDVPWANTAKHSRFVLPPRATGLWTRYGQPIQAPDWWLDKLPKTVSLDGELWAGQKGWQTVSSITRTQDPEKVDWTKIRYVVFDKPNHSEIVYDSTINLGANFKKTLKGCLEWLENLGVKVQRYTAEQQTFYERLHDLKGIVPNNGVCDLLGQSPLPSSTPKCKEVINDYLNMIESQGGEGLMLKSPIGFYRPERSYDLLKVKRVHDMEGEVVGYKWGKPTDVEKSISGTPTDRLLGLMGSVTLRLESGVVFDLASGFDMHERKMRANAIGDGIPKEECDDIARKHGEEHAGQVVDSNDYYNPLMPVGAKLTFKYRELSDSGVPKEARFHRVRED